MMRKKIIGIFVIMLLIATASPVSGSLEEREEGEEKHTSTKILYCIDTIIGYLSANVKIDTYNHEPFHVLQTEDINYVTYIGLAVLVYHYTESGNYSSRPGFIIKTIQNPDSMQGAFIDERIFVPSEDYVTVSGYVFRIPPHILPLGVFRIIV